MNLMIDGTPLIFRRAGIGRYTYELVRRVATGPTRVRLANLGFRPAGVRVPPAVTVPAIDQLIRRQRRAAVAFHVLLWKFRPAVLAAQARLAGTDVYFAPNFIGAYGRSFRTVITVHDMVYHLFPQFTQPHMLKALARDLPRHAERADVVVTDSESTRRDVVGVLGVRPERVRVVPLAASPEFVPVTDDAARRAIRVKYALPERFVLFVGTLEPRKNLLTLFAAVEKLAAAGLPHKLVLVGATGWKSAREQDRLNDLKARGLAAHLGYVVDADLPAIYSCADAFAFPSWYEGFGIPPLEAMACGVPVVTSNTSSLPEVCGDAAEYFDPNSAEELFEKLRAVLTDPIRQAELRDRGFRQAARFSWDRTADELLRLFRECTQHTSR